MLRRSFTLICLFTLLLLPLACRDGSVGQQIFSTDTSSSSRSNTLYFSGGQPRTLDPALSFSGPGGEVGHIFSGLVSLDKNLQVQPELAAGWEISDDGMVYTFYLRKNALFHNGKAVTADDVIYSWTRAASPELGSDTVATYLNDIVGIDAVIAGETDSISGLRAIDAHTLEVTIDAPKVYFMHKLVMPVAFVVDEENVVQENWQKRPNGTGPFLLQTWQDDILIVLARNPHYYLELAKVSYVELDMGTGIPLSLYETGEIDVVGIGGSNLDRVTDPNNPLSADLITGVNMCTQFVGLNSQLPPLDDVRVRQALALAFDQDRIIDGLYGGNALPADGLLPPGMPGFGGLEPLGFDPERAKVLLREAGVEDETFVFTTSGYSGAGGLVTAVSTLWQENLGLDVEVELIDPFNYFDELYAGNLGHFYTFGWCADYVDPQNFLDILFHSGVTQNIGRYANDDVDALLEAARSEADSAKRIQLYKDAEQMLVDDAAAIFVSHSLSSALVSPRLRGYELTPIGVRQWHTIEIVE